MDDHDLSSSKGRDNLGMNRKAAANIGHLFNSKVYLPASPLGDSTHARFQRARRVFIMGTKYLLLFPEKSASSSFHDLPTSCVVIDGTNIALQDKHTAEDQGAGGNGAAAYEVCISSSITLAPSGDADGVASSAQIQLVINRLHNLVTYATQVPLIMYRPEGNDQRRKSQPKRVYNHNKSLWGIIKAANARLKWTIHGNHSGMLPTAPLFFFPPKNFFRDDRLVFFKRRREEGVWVSSEVWARETGG